MYKAYRFKMYPDDKQEDNKSFWISRFIYNHFLEEKQKEYSKDECKEGDIKWNFRTFVGAI